VAIVVGVAVAIGLVGGHSFPDYDATFALIWGREITHGVAPNYKLPFRPAGHPLTTLVGVVGSPLGRDGAAELLRWVALLGAGAFVASVFRFGQALFGTLAGVVAAALLFTRSPLWGYSLLGFMDAWAATFVVWAALLEVHRPRRGLPVFVLLALAGLIRPEVWLFVAAYWVWIAIGSPTRALKLLPLAALGPLAWIAWDLATSQTFLGSVATAEGLPVATSAAGNGLNRAPDALVRYLGGFARPPEVIAAAVGAALLALSDWRRGVLPAALLVLNVFTFVVVAARNGPLEQRYLLVASAMGLVFAGYAIAQIAPTARVSAQARGTRPPPALRGPGIRIVAGVLAAACILYAPIDARRMADLRDQVTVANAVDSELRAVVQSDAAKCGLRGHVHVPDVRLRPFIAYWAGAPLERIDTSPGGTASLSPQDTVAQQLVSRSLPEHTERNPLPNQPADPDVLSSSQGWSLSGACARQ
jgi:hypothetical protein